MRVLVIGAGASIEEARRAEVPEELWPPTMANFAEKMWHSPLNSFYCYWLEDYLREIGITQASDPTSEFIKLAKDPENRVNIERLFEYCWLNKHTKSPDHWEQLIIHGVLQPLNDLLLMAFYPNGKGVQLHAGKMVSRFLKDGDLVLNLNYDTLFEIAARQAGQRITYIPNPYPGDGLRIAKPHGSLNLLANASHFKFANPECIGALHSGADDYRNYHAVVPPRFNKNYVEHDIAKIIFASINELRPEKMTFWGVGLTESDTDLLETYRKWVSFGSLVEVINPDQAVTKRAQGLLNTNVRYYSSLEEWAT